MGEQEIVAVAEVVDAGGVQEKEIGPKLRVREGRGNQRLVPRRQGVYYRLFQPKSPLLQGAAFLESVCDLGNSGAGWFLW